VIIISNFVIEEKIRFQQIATVKTFFQINIKKIPLSILIGWRLFALFLWLVHQIGLISGDFLDYSTGLWFL